ncbi:GNAT family N-acetyltransferase [Halobium salinum]|uniref:GNAT family N-acetyltransferase n=1 Tax=Halobium salinum TaxID=1364940 RepID=A0ABD5PA33_9EURY|nr:N-acetyltransferase [Halobium salinum]
MTGASREPAGGAEIRRATTADRPTLVDLQRRLPERSPELLDYGVVVGDVLVSTAGGRPVGYLLPAHGDGAHVAELVVGENHRREGRATALLDALFDSLPPGDEVTIAVAPDNDAALALYEGYGFEVVEEREGYFAGGPALVLSRSVSREREAETTDGR